MANELSSNIEVDSDFPGGNIILEKVEKGTVYIHQDLRDTSEDWFYWCFRLRNAAGKKLKFVFTKSKALGVLGPAISFDEGVSWKWLGSEVVDGNSFSYEFPLDVSEVRLSFAMPYQESRWLTFIESVASNSLFEQKVLCKTPKGRDVECVFICDKQKTVKHRVAITSRHHCCEMMATYSLEGLMRWILEDPDAQWLRENVEFFFVPFVDKDGSEEGDQGKCRKPRDHGRDYAGESIYSSTRAIRDFLSVWSEDKLRVGIDLHCPWISGVNNEKIYIVGSPDKKNAGQQEVFNEILESVAKEALPFHAEGLLPFGVDWNVNSNFSEGRGFASWVSGLPSTVLGTSFEVPYANADGVDVDQKTATDFGKDLGRALLQYLKKIPD